MHERLEPTSLIMSGVESDSYYGIALEAGITKMLISFLYIQRKGSKFLRERLGENKHIKIMLDSGAFTFHVKEEEYKNKPLKFWEDYLDRYTKFILKNKDIIYSCVELDIGNIVGVEKVDEWREKYFKPLEEAGILVCYVWHEYDGLPHWEEMCRKFKYVGFSLESNDLSISIIIKMINTAKRYNSLVHGFAATDIKMLSQLPFFTVDSTTWLVGTKYGELNWFDGRTMKRLKKAVWKRQYKTKFIKLGANWDLAEQENPYELIRINLLVFLKVEEYIRKRLGIKMYWVDGMKKVKKVSSLKRISSPQIPQEPVKEIATESRALTKYEEFMSSKEIKFPPKEWFDGDMEDYQQYCKMFKIGEDLDKDEATGILWDYCAFLGGYTSFDDIDDDDLINICEFHFSETFGTKEERYEKVKQFYQDNLDGKRKSFSGNNLPEAQEREEYFEYEESELVDIHPEELTRYLTSSGMDEVDAYDKELKDMGILAVRDEKGRFLKGQKRVRKPKNIYSNQFPKLVCDTCYKSGDCPEYKAGYICKFDKLLSGFDTRNTEDVVDALTSIANLNLGRMQLMAMFEKMDGGMADPGLSALIDQNLKILNMVMGINNQRQQILARQKSVITSGGEKITETEIMSGGGGILERMFMGSSESTEDIIDTEIVEKP